MSPVRHKSVLWKAATGLVYQKKHISVYTDLFCDVQEIPHIMNG